MESSSLVRCVWTAVRRPLSLCVRVCGCEIVSVCVSRARARVSVVSGSFHSLSCLSLSLYTERATTAKRVPVKRNYTEFRVPDRKSCV